MERKEQEPPGGPPQAAEGEDSQLSEEKRAFVALARILGSGPLGGRSLQLLEQLADCIQRPQTEMLREAEPAKQAAGHDHERRVGRDRTRGGADGGAKPQW
jgi:hypothetical protein